jgi:hypothetical protein
MHLYLSLHPCMTSTQITLSTCVSGVPNKQITALTLSTWSNLYCCLLCTQFFLPYIWTLPLQKNKMMSSSTKPNQTKIVRLFKQMAEAINNVTNSGNGPNIWATRGTVGRLGLHTYLTVSEKLVLPLGPSGMCSIYTPHTQWYYKCTPLSRHEVATDIPVIQINTPST